MKADRLVVRQNQAIGTNLLDEKRILTIQGQSCQLLTENSGRKASALNDGPGAIA